MANNVRSIVRRYVAVDTDTPIPVPSAIYAAIHIGHLGMKAKPAIETIHPARSPRRRFAWDGMVGGLPLPGISLREPPDIASQHK